MYSQTVNAKRLNSHKCHFHNRLSALPQAAFFSPDLVKDTRHHLEMTLPDRVHAVQSLPAGELSHS